MELTVRPSPVQLHAGVRRKPIFPSGVPNLRVIHERYQQVYTALGVPYFLPTYERVQEILGNGADGKPILGGSSPWCCVGPKIRLNQRRVKFPCFKHNFCLYCAERKAYLAAQRAVRTHHANPVVVKFSVSLPAVRTNADRVKHAKARLARVLREHGYTELNVNVHVFGENPFEGPKGHLDGIASGEDPDQSFLTNEPVNPRLETVLEPYHTKPDGSAWQIYVSSRRLDSRNKKTFLRDLVLGGYYSGRSTVNPRRIFAGMYGTPPAMAVRMTNVQRGQRIKDVRDLTGIDGRPLRHFTQAELVHVQATAERWDDLVGRPVHAREPPFNAAIWSTFKEGNAWWRHIYRLPLDDPE